MSSLAEQTRWLDATDQAALVASGEVKPGELVEAAIERIEQFDPDLGAVTLRYFDQARQAAAAPPAGPLTGVPFLVKDLLTDVAGQVCTDANVALKAQARVATVDSPLVARYRAAGLIFAGRSASCEFGTVPGGESAAWGVTRNPWNTALSPGGSSGGAASAVAAGLVPAAHGTDAGGSIRVPASCCGLVGLKPSRVGEGPVQSVFDLIAELGVTRSVRDTALLLDIARGGGGYRAELGVDPGRLRVGLLDTRFDGAPVQPDCAEAARSAARLLESLGHHVEPGFPAVLADSSLDRLFAAFWTAGMGEVLGELAVKLGRDVTEADVEPLSWVLGELAAKLPAEDLEAALGGVAGFNWTVVSWWDDHDLLLTPTAAEPPLPTGTLASNPADPMAPLRRSDEFAPFTPFVNFTGQPAISLPLHVGAGGLPIGVQLVAAPGCEDLLLRVAAQLEVAAPWQDRRPAR